MQHIGTEKVTDYTKLIAGKAIKLLPNYCPGNVFITSSYISTCLVTQFLNTNTCTIKFY